MASSEHLEQLQQGVVHWNQWRSQHPDLAPDLSGSNLSDLDLQGANLSQVNLQGANLVGTNLYEADLRGANLQEAILRWSDSREAKFTKATFTRTPTMSLHLETSLLARGAIAVN